MGEKTKYEESLFKNNTQSNKLVVGIISVVLILILMIFSKLYLPNKLTSKDSVPMLFEKIGFSENRVAEMESCIYDKDQEIIEIMMLVTNKNMDGIDDYYYAATGVGNVFFKSKNLVVEEVINNTLCLVVRIHNVKGFDEIEFLMAPKIALLSQIKDIDTLVIPINKYNLTEETIDLEKTEKAYLVDRLSIAIKNIQDNISISEEKIEELSTTKSALEDENINIEESKIYLTDAEKGEADEKIASNLNAITSIEKQIKEIKESIAELETNLEDAKVTKEKIQNET